MEKPSIFDKIKGILPNVSGEKKMKIITKFIRAPVFDYRILYEMLLKESNNSTSSAPPQENYSTFVGVKIMQKPTVLRFKASSIPSYVPTISGPDNNNVIKHQTPITGNPTEVSPDSSKSDLDDDYDDHPQFKDKNNVVKNHEPITGNSLHTGSKRPRTDMDEDYDDQEEKGGAKKRSKNKSNGVPKPKVIASVIDPANVPDMPEELEQLMNRVKGSNPVFVIQKRLYKSDVSRGHGRLSLPLSQVNPQFLNQEEKEKLLMNRTLDLKIYEPCGEHCVITLTKWNMGSPIYNLISTWNDVVRRNDLTEGTVVQLWSFRVGLGLCVFLVINKN